MAFFDSGTLSQLDAGYKSPSQAAAPKGPGGVKGFLTNALPAIGGGLGAVAGIPLDFLGGAGSIAGGAAGAGLGETLKRNILHENLDPKQIAIQAAEGGAAAAFNPLKILKGASGASKAFVKGGAQTAENVGANAATQDTGSTFLKNLTTQGQQAQGRVAGVSAGSKVAGKELTPQDTVQMLDTLKNEGIQTGNANNTLRDVTDKLKGYGQQISDHFKTTDSPLHADDTKQIADNFISSLKTTDPAILDQAQIIANDLQKNVKSTKDLWNFRKTLDSKIPDSKFMDAATTNKVAALKSTRQYISDELGSVPGMSNYHALSEVKPFISREANRLNNPGGGVVGRLLSSGPAQTLENAAGKTAEKIGQMGAKTEVPLKAAAGSPPPINPEDAINAAVSTPPTPVGTGFLNSLTKGIKSTATLPARAAAAPLAFPGQSAGAVVKQEAARGFGAPEAISQAQQQGTGQSQEPDISGAITQASSVNPDTSNDPFAPENVQSNVQTILSQGGKMSDVSAYLSNVKAYEALTTPSNKKLNATQQQQANNANSGLKDIQSLTEMLAKDPSLTLKSALPGGSITQRLAGTTDYEAAKNNIVDVISRLRSGAAISASEEKLYKSLLPSAGDSAESAKSKLTRLSNLLGSFSNPSASNGSDVTDLLANSGATQ